MNNLTTVETACNNLATAGQAITFTAIAEHTGISRTTSTETPTSGRS